MPTDDVAAEDSAMLGFSVYRVPKTGSFVLEQAVVPSPLLVDAAFALTVAAVNPRWHTAPTRTAQRSQHLWPTFARITAAADVHALRIARASAERWLVPAARAVGP